MIAYVTLGTNDLEKAVKFYDALLAEIGAKRILEEEGHFVAWGHSLESPSLSVITPFDGKPASVGNGNMVALFLENPDKIDAFYKKAIELGATDEGKPGPRTNGSFYAAYFRDLDGNKLNGVCMLENN
ncbi:MAG: VOC family protein [Rhodospirillales bacterium]|nr:VOC family protein [Rhodospirillales bacterium]